MSSKLITSIAVESGLEGPQLVFGFTMPVDAVDKVRMVRKILSYPEHAEDGVMVQEFTDAPSTAVVYSDLDLIGGETFYYQFMSYEGGQWHFGPTTRISALALASGIYVTRLWNFTTGLYQSLDEVGLA